MARTAAEMLAALLLCSACATLVAGQPAFLGPSSRIAYIDENSPAGTTVLTVHAFDATEDPFTFGLTSTQFTIGSTSGIVQVGAAPTPALDREQIASISIFVDLIDSGGSVVNTLPIEVFLNDVNDNSPVWVNQVASVGPFPEDLPIGSVIYSIVVTDADIGENGNFQFRIETPTDGIFAVNSAGVVTLARSLDADLSTMHTITIIVEDEGDHTQPTTISFTVPVDHVVSPAPIFSQSHYFITLHEGDYSTTNFNNLITVVAVSPTDPTAFIEYAQVLRGVPSDSFFSVTSAGVVNVVGNIDREDEPTYDVLIEAYIVATGLANSASGTALLTVTVLDVNDNSPVFENPHPNAITLMETTPVSSIVYTFYATDADQGTNADITYELIAPVNGPFSIGGHSGVIQLADALAFVVAEMYTITVSAKDGGTPQRETMISLTINVGNVITAPPTFSESVYTFEIAEGIHADSQVGVVLAVDPENPATSPIRYQQIMRGDASDTLFSVGTDGATAGRIGLTGTVNREAVDIYTLSIEAYRVLADGDTTPESEVGIVSVSIIIEDVNDNIPVWISAFPDDTILESQPIGTDIFTAIAIDADLGSNGRITYSFVSPPANLPFSIDADSGVIRLTSVLDFDTDPEYILTIQAQDGGSTPNPITDTLTLTVVDVLDLPPIFTESVYTVDVTEGTYTGGIIGAVRALETVRPSAIIRYEKVSGNAIFTVESSGANAGAVMLTGDVDAEGVTTYTVVIRAFRVTVDNTPRSGISTVSMIVTILDINDNDPVWTDPTPGPISILETRPIGTDVFVVAATDADSGTAGDVTYSLPPLPGPFAIGTTTGIIKLTGLLDFIDQAQYNLVVSAQDGATPPRIITATLTINVVNVFDPAPIFTESIYTPNIIEDTYTDQLVGTVLAIDPQNPATAVLRYEIVPPGNALFTIGNSGTTAGHVTVTGILDRETVSTYSISIRAFRVVSDSDPTPLSDVGIVSMLITVTDDNDNSPVFLNEASNPITILETRAVGSVIYTFHAVDLDSGTNGEITFSLEAPPEAPFVIDSGSGVIRIRNTLDFDLTTSYALTIRASDGATRFTDTILMVTVLDILDPPPSFSLSSYHVEVAEGVHADQLVGTVIAVDVLHPTTAEIRYEQILKGDVTDSLFRVVESDAMAGQVLLTGTVGIEVESYTINIRAFRVLGTDVTPRSEISTVSMTITIIDINDNPPVILNPAGSPVPLLETRAVGTVVYSFHATDSDLGSNGMITFSLAPAASPFAIDAASGIVRLTNHLDFNVAQSYSLTITAEDGGDTMLSVDTPLTVNVVDVTDPPPAFTLNEYTFSVNEGEANVLIGSVEAIDSASPDTAIIKYEQVLKGDATDGMFSVEEDGVGAGNVRIVTAADREAVPSYLISVRAFRVATMGDSTPISAISIVSVIVSIDDVNDNTPVILNPSGTIDVFETRLLGSVIYTVFATDADAGSNAEITYSLTSPVSGPFSIGPSTGIIVLSRILDFDIDETYTVTVLAQDGGAGTSTTMTSFTVNVVDILDPPPTFSRSIYNVELVEGTYDNHVLLTVEAVDSLHPAAIIRYEQVMKGDGTDALFAVESSGPDAGQITLTGIIDREGDRTHTMNVRAFRVATAASATQRSEISIVTVVLTALDGNDNAPVLHNPPNQNIPIVETALVGTVVYSLVVTDADEGSNSRLNFALAPSTAPFAVDHLGVVTVIGTLDSTVTAFFGLTITASDEGSTPMTTDFTLNVEVTPAVAAPPTVRRLVHTISAPEADYSVTALHVTDIVGDPGTVGCTISYSIQARNDGTQTPFTVESTSGSVDFLGVLDRETQATWTITILATEIDSGTLSPKGTTPALATVVLIAADVNDNIPTFISDHVFGSVPELSRIGDVAAGGVQAFDIDEGTNAALGYFLASDAPPDLPFAVNPVSGVVSVSAPLDYEMTTSYTFSVVARETSTTDMFSSTTVVSIIVVNENDNLPMFAETAYTFQVAENLPPAPLITSTPPGLLTITATDIDIGPFGDSTYILVGFGVPASFEVDTATGVISTTAPLDYEERTIYHLTLVAEDGGGTLTDPNRGNTQIVIEVLDENDNIPVCFPTSTTVNLEENIVHTNFLTITAFDDDAPNTPNSLIVFSIGFSDTTPSNLLFTIDPANGEISSAALDYEAVPSHIYSLIVYVTDSGTSPLSSMCSLTVIMRDFNDHAPAFTQNVYTSTVMENTPIGTHTGITVVANDPEPEHTITYFPVTSDPQSVFFVVERLTGAINVGQPIDADPLPSHTVFTFGVLAIDDSTPPLTGTTTVVVNVAPENDNTPIFSNPLGGSMDFTIVEDMGTAIPVSLITVNADDLDGDAVTYSFTTTNPFLTLDPVTGDVALVATLDFETQTSHIVGIQACDPLLLCSSVNLNIMVTDYNDNAPMFDASSLTPMLTMNECEITNQLVIATLIATDGVDTGPRATVEYSAVGGDINRFSVETSTGIVRITENPTTPWDFELGPNLYTFNVRGTDFPGGSPRLSTPQDAMITFTVTDCNDFPTVFSAPLYTFSIDEAVTGPAANMEVFTGIMTSDGDATAANRVPLFSIVDAPSSTYGWFGIDSSSGSIHVLSGAVVDRESSLLSIDSMGRGDMSFNVIVVNTAPTGTFTSTATVTVTILDINDHDPMFLQANPITVSVAEQSTPGTLVTVVSAVDVTDFGDNTHVEYEIVSGNDDSMFGIGTLTGAVTVVGELNAGLTENYRLGIRATETRGVPASTPANIFLDITVIEGNDNSPIFNFPTYTTNIEEYDAITESTIYIPGDVIITVEATDADGIATFAGMIEYRVSVGEMQLGVRMFAILDPSSGDVSILRPDLIDHEDIEEFTLTLEAYDLVRDIEKRRIGTAQLIVNVVDLDDSIPIFQDPSYLGSVLEGQPIGTIVTVAPTLRVIDADNNGINVLSFSLSSTDFFISSDGTTISTAVVLDREILLAVSYLVTITVFATDGRGNMGSTTLTITINDINDNPPCFPSSVVTTYSVEENREIFPNPDSLVGTIQAEDLDKPINPQITYFLSGGDNGQFDIDPQTGMIHVISELNREDIAFYTLNVTSTDGNLTCGIQLSITILEANDNDPIFNQNPYLGSVVENSPINTPVDENFTMTGIPLQVAATDIDVNPVLTYTVLPQDTDPVPFDVDSVTGNLFTNATGIDRETLDRYRFFIQVHDGLRSSNTLIEIVVLDTNDLPPVFVRDFINVTVPELTPALFVFVFVEATDGDLGTNAEITYRLNTVDPPSAINMFDVSSDRGGVFANEEVIISQNDPLVITITIFGSNIDSSVPAGDPVPTDVATVEITIDPQNINAPNFTSPHYIFSVMENVNNVVVGQVTAIEPSGDVNTVITYDIFNNGAPDSMNFMVNANDGSVTNTIEFDREMVDLYQFSIRAQDNAAIPRFGFTTISVRILDVNDNPPIFLFDPYPVTVPESTAPQTVFLTVFTTDADIGVNADVSYSIVAGDTSVFAIDPLSGEIRTLVSIDREVIGFYNITVAAMDGGTPSLTTNVEVIITVGDVNDNDPIIDESSLRGANGTIQVFEDAVPPYTFTTVIATDADINGNAQLIYTFDLDYVTVNGPFRVERSTGLIILRNFPDGMLDRETIDTYEVPIVVSDQAGTGPAIRTDTSSFTVEVLDVNDNVPVFDLPLFDFGIFEASPVGSTIGRVTGTDADIGINARIRFHLIGDDLTDTRCVGSFCINQFTGDLLIAEMLDTETQAVYTVPMAISNNITLEFDAVTRELIDANTGTARVEALDSNDQPPIFVQSTLFGTIEEDAAFGTSITTIEATDLDTGNGSVIWFNIVTSNAPFVVQQNTGEVVSAGVFRGQSGDTISVNVRAFDNFGLTPSLSTIDVLSVLVYRCDQQLELSSTLQREIVIAGLDEISSVLMEVTKARPIFTTITVRQTQAGTVDVTGTDLKFISLNLEDGRILDPAAILRVVDENYAIVESVFEVYGIENIGLEICSEPPTEFVTSIPNYVWAIVAIIVLALCCLCCCCLLLCIGEKRKSRKWKSKALKSFTQTDEFSHQQMSMFSGHENPMWVDPFPYVDVAESTTDTGKSTTERENPLYESQELTVEMRQEHINSDEDDLSTVPDQVYESQELFMEMFTEDKSSLGDSQTNLIKKDESDVPEKMYESQELEMEMFADDDMKGSQSTVGSSRVEPSKPKQDLGSPQSTDKTRLLDEVEGDNLYESQEVLLEMFADDESSQASIQLTGDSQPHLSNGAAKQGHAQVSKKDLGSRGQTSRAQTSGKTSQTSRAQTSGKTSQSSRAQTSQSSRGKTSQTSRAQTSQSSRAQTSQSSRGKTSQTTHIQKVQVETYEDESETETLVGSEEEKGDGLYESQEILMEMFADDVSSLGDSETNVVKAPRRDNLNQDDLLDRALDEDSITSFI